MPLVWRALSGSKSTLMYPSMAVSSFLVVQLVVLACSHQLPWYQPGIIHWYLLPNMLRLYACESGENRTLGSERRGGAWH